MLVLHRQDNPVHSRQERTMKPLVTVVLLFVACVSANFQFFDQFFGGQQQQHQTQQKQDGPSDSVWYQQSWEGSMCLLSNAAIVTTVVPTLMPLPSGSDSTLEGQC